MDYVPGYKVVKSFGLVTGICSKDSVPMVADATNSLKTYALQKYPECNAIIGGSCSHSLTYVHGSTYINVVFTVGTAVRIEPER